MRVLIDDIQLFNRDFVDHVEHIDARNVNSVAFNHIDQLVNGSILSEGDIGVGELVFFANRHDGLIRHMSQL